MAGDLDERLLAAHASADVQKLVALYTEAADRCEIDGDVDAACFYLTHAFVFALQVGAEDAIVLQQRLYHHGRAVQPCAAPNP